MSAAAAIALSFLFGIPVARLLDRDAPPARWAGEAMLIGIALVAASLLLLSMAGVGWTPLAAIALAAVAATACIRRTRAVFVAPHPLDAITAVVLVAYARFATAAAPWELDFIDDWGLKGRVFWHARGIDWYFLENGWNWWAHPDYPLVLPLWYDFAALLGGAWDDRWLGILTAAFAAAGVLIVRSLAEDELQSRGAGAFAGLVMVWLFCTPWVGIADGPLVACVVPGLLLVRSGRFTPGAVLLGIGASCKNEGVTFIVAAIVAMACMREMRHGILRMWPAVAIPLPWLVIRSVHGLQTDLVAGPMLARAAAHLRQPDTYFSMLSAYSGGKPLLWTGVVIGGLVALSGILRRQRLLLIVAGLQTIFYLGAYVVTPLELAFHIRWSWDRLVWHVTAVVVVAVLLELLPLCGWQRNEAGVARTS